MDLATVQARLAEMQARYSPPPPARLSPPVQARTFDSVLQDTLAAAPAGANGGTAAPLTPAERLAPGQYGSLKPPEDLLRYGNGRIPTDALTPIGEGSHRLWAPAAKAFTQLAAAKADGVTIGVTDSYRDNDSQVGVAKQKGLYSQGGLAAARGRAPTGGASPWTSTSMMRRSSGCATTGRGSASSKTSGASRGTGRTGPPPERPGLRVCGCASLSPPGREWASHRQEPHRLRMPTGARRGGGHAIPAER